MVQFPVYLNSIHPNLPRCKRIRFLIGIRLPSIPQPHEILHDKFANSSNLVGNRNIANAAKRSKTLNPTHLQPLDSLLERGRPRLHNGLLLLLLLLGHLHSRVDLNRAGASVGTIYVTEPSSGQRACRGQGSPSQRIAAAAAASHCNRSNAAPPAQRQDWSGVS